MTILNLTHAEWTVIKGLALSGGSTSETLCYGFVTGELTPFTHNYVRFCDAWDRLNAEQKQAVIDIRRQCNLDDESQKITLDNFIKVFIGWKSCQLLAQKEREFWSQEERNPQYPQHYYDDEELPPKERKSMELSVKKTLSPHM